MNAPPPIRVGLLLDSLTLPAWAWVAVDLISRQPEARIAVLLVNAKPTATTTPLFYRSYRRLEKKIFALKPNAFALRDASGLLAETPTLTLHPKSEGGCDHLDTPAQLATYQIDVLIQLGFGLLTGPILDAPPLGLWSFHQEQNTLYRNGLNTFNAVLDGRPTAQLKLYCQGSKQHLLYASPSSCHSLSVDRTRNQLYWKAAAALPRLLAQLHRLGPEPFFATFAAKRPPDQPLEPPSNGTMFKLLAGHLKRNLWRGVQKLYRYEQWGLLVSADPTFKRNLASFTALTPPADRLWADPFLLYRNGTYYLFCEEMHYKDKKGHIALIELDQTLAVRRGPTAVLQRPYHLSYPFLLEWEDQLYMIPETHANGTVEVYRCVDFPHRWEFHQYLMEDICASDATLYCWQNRWWLFANIVERPGITNRDELYLFYSDHPLSTTWTPHPQNPIVSDVNRARPGGPLYVENGQLFRPSQNSSKRYGYGLKINRILTLDPNTYREEETESIEPTWDKHTVATHTLARAHHLSAADAKTSRWRLARFFGRRFH